MLWPKAIQASYSAVEQKSVDDLQEYNLDEFQHAVVTKAAVRWKLAVLCSLAFNTILLTYSIWSSAAFWKPEHPSQLSHSSVLEFPYEVRTFELDALFLSPPSSETDAAWDYIASPTGRGLIDVKAQLGLDLPNDTQAGLSLFHQLHCLGKIRKFTWNLVYGKLDMKELLATWPANVTNPTYDQAVHGMWHIAHCFDYIRQSIQCSGDVSVEYVKPNAGVVDGVKYAHDCKSWEAIEAFALRSIY